MLTEIVKGVLVCIISILIIFLITYWLSESKSELLIENQGHAGDKRSLGIELVRRVLTRKLTATMLENPALRNLIKRHLKTAYNADLNISEHTILTNYESYLADIQLDPAQNKHFLKLLADPQVQDELEFDQATKKKYNKLLELYDPQLDDTYLNHYLITHLADVKSNPDFYRRQPTIDLT